MNAAALVSWDGSCLACGQRRPTRYQLGEGLERAVMVERGGRVVGAERFAAIGRAKRRPPTVAPESETS